MIRRGLLGVVLVAWACAPFDAPPATSTSSDAGIDDASADAPSSANPTGDAGGGGVDGIGRASPCTEKHVICEDFDGQWAGWGRVDDPSSRINADGERFVSLPTSLLVEVNGKSPKGNHPAYLRRQVPSAQRFVLSADVLVALSNGPDSEVDVLGLELTPTGFERYFAAIVVKADGKFYLEIKVRESGPMAPPPIETQLSLGPITEAFAHVSIDLDLAAGRVVAAVDGKQQATDVSLAGSTTGTLSVGAAWAANTIGKYSVNIDNVVLD